MLIMLPLSADHFLTMINEMSMQLDAAPLLAQAVAAHRTGDLALARGLYEAVLRIDPQHADALQLLGLLAQQSGDLRQARALMEASIRLQPQVARVHYNLAIVRSAQGDVTGAISAYEAAISCAPEYAEAHSNLGNAYQQAGQHEAALRAYEAAIELEPDFAVAHVNRGAILIALERYPQAVAALETAVSLAPEMAQAHANLGQAYRRQRRFREAAAASRAALALHPGYVEAYLNLAMAAAELDELPAALEANARALELAPGNAEAHCNAAWFFHMAGRYTESIAAAQIAIGLRPAYAEAHVNLALSLLVCGELARGWEEYVWMWRTAARRAHYPLLDRIPLWRGEGFAGRSLLITRDQGHGDALQMARYFPAVKARGGRVIVETLPALAPLFDALPGIDELRVVSHTPVAVEGIDLQIPILGLPGALETRLETIPAPIPYVRATPERIARFRPLLERAGELRVGIVWAGNAEHGNDHHRSLRLEDFASLGALERIAWFGLQKGRDEDRRSSGALELEPLGARIDDFADTAAIVTQLDLLITVDTSIAHLAGALGTPVWTLLPFAPDWRWLIARADSPWYPTMRLFRQPRPGDWEAVFAEVACALRALRDTETPCGAGADPAG